MRGVWRITLVAAAAAVATALAVVYLQDRTVADVSACGSGVRTAAGYTATVQTRPDPPSAAGTVVLVTVEHDDRPVSGAEVCLSTDMVGMPMGGGTTFQGRELSPGRYEVIVTFGMPGTWAGQLVVSSAGRAVLSQPVRFQVS